MKRSCKAGGANLLAGKARDYQVILSELSNELGSSFPVYVLFTKADKIPYFREFVENLNEAPEVAEMMGPLSSHSAVRVFRVRMPSASLCA